MATHRKGISTSSNPSTSENHMTSSRSHHFDGHHFIGSMLSNHPNDLFPCTVRVLPRNPKIGYPHNVLVEEAIPKIVWLKSYCQYLLIAMTNPSQFFYNTKYHVCWLCILSHCIPIIIPLYILHFMCFLIISPLFYHISLDWLNHVTSRCIPRYHN